MRILKRTKTAASTLVLVLCITALFAATVGSLLSLSSQAYLTSDRNNDLAEALIVAQSELDYMFFEWGNALVRGDAYPDVPGNYDVYWTEGAESTHPSLSTLKTLNFPSGSPSLPWRMPYLQAHQADWRVMRTMEIVTFGTDENGNPAYDMSGTWGGTDLGKSRYFISRVTVLRVGGDAGGLSASAIRGASPLAVQIGRRFSTGELSPFQNMFSYTGRLEFNPLGTTTIDGDISANGDVYLGAAHLTGRLNMDGRVRVGGYLNDTPDGSPTYTPPTGVSDYNADGDSRVNYDNYYGAANKNDPTWNNGGAYDSESDARQAKVERLNRAKEVTGLNPAALSEKYPSMFPTPNDARHLVVDPPPPSGDLPDVAPYRMYNRAGIRVMINNAGSVTIEKVTASGATTLTLPGVVVNGTSVDGKTYTVNQPVYDAREDKMLKVTTIDVGALTNAINSNPTLKAHFDDRPILYISNSNTADGVIRLVNAESTPGAIDDSESSTGFTVATNNQMYVQGDVNTTLNPDGELNSVSLIADAVTALSGAWNDSLAVEDSYVAEEGAGRPASNPNGSSGTNYVDPRSGGNLNNDVGAPITTNNITTINAGILTGNVPTSGSTSSGGAHNLVRYLENWEGKAFLVNGSLGQIFESKYGTAGLSTASNYANEYVYRAPTNRFFFFNDGLAKNPPKGSPSTKFYSSGDMFVFTR